MRDHTWAGRALRGFLVAVMILPFVGYFAPVALAHHSTITTAQDCIESDGTWDFTYTVTGATDFGSEPEDLQSPSVEVWFIWDGATPTSNTPPDFTGAVLDQTGVLVWNGEEGVFPFFDGDGTAPSGTTKVTIWAVPTAPWSDGTPAAGSARWTEIVNREYCLSSVTVIKNTENPETSAEFSFLLDSFELFSDERAVEGDGDFYTWSKLASGTYDLTELVAQNPSRYSLISSSCVLEPPEDQLSAAASGTPIGTPIANGMSFELGSGDHVVCTFTNRHSAPPDPDPGSITIVKQTEVSTGTFSFTLSNVDSFDLTTTAVGEAGRVSKMYAGLVPGTYSVSEDASGAGWTLTSATCSDGSSPDAVALAEGEDVTCVFINEFTQVSPTTVVNTTTTATAAPTVETLPFTGASSGGMGGAAMGLVLLGGLVLLAVRGKDDTLPRHRAR